MQGPGKKRKHDVDSDECGSVRIVRPGGDIESQDASGVVHLSDIHVHDQAMTCTYTYAITISIEVASRRRLHSHAIVVVDTT